MFNDKSQVVGILNIVVKKVLHPFTFLNYVYGGTELNLIVGIDYCYSQKTNKHPDQPESLHYMNGESNLYMDALRDSINILSYFDLNGSMPMYGFGAKLPPYLTYPGKCFACNGDFFDPCVKGGVEKVVETYKD